MKKISKTSSQKKSDTGRVHLLSSGFKVSTYKQAPEDFSPVKATPKELLLYGYPRRPDRKREPELSAAWDRVFAKSRRTIIPQFMENPGTTHGRAKKLKTKKMPDGRTNGTSSTWSGAVQFARANTAYSWVAGQWTVPNPHAPGDGTFKASEWVGIDGDGSTDVLQAGTETQVTKVFFFQFAKVYLWWEWYPSNEVAITNLDVSAGDVMYCLICSYSNTTATIYLTNQSTGDSTSFDITAPAGTTLVGNSAEWIVERPATNGVTQSLSDFGVVYFDECLAFSKGSAGQFVDNLAGATPLTMTGAGNAVLSQETIENDHVLKLEWKKSG